MFCIIYVSFFNIFLSECKMGGYGGLCPPAKSPDVEAIKKLEMKGIEPLASCMQSTRSAPELHPPN